MRKLLLAAILFFVISNVWATPDDSLPKGVPSRFLVFPFFLRSPETNWGFGMASAFFFKARKNDDHIRTSDVNLVALYTLRQQVVVVLGSTIFFPDEKEIFRFQTSYSYYPDKFWGLGNNSEESAKEDYTLKQFFFNPQLLFKLFRKFYFGASYEMQNISDFHYEPGGVFETDDIVGREGGFTSGAGILITYDSRNSAYSPAKGIFAEVNATRFSNIFGSDFNFTCYTLDYRNFFPAGKNRVFGIQAFGRFCAGETPYRYLSMLGGPELMRGYYKGRYTDKCLIAFQGELRQYIFWRLGVTAFAGAGQVSSLVKNFRIDDFHYSYGGGIRIMVQEKEKLNLRIDFGFGEKSSGIYVILKEAF